MTTATRRPPSVAAAVAALDPDWTPPKPTPAETTGQGNGSTAPAPDRVAEAEILEALRAGRFKVDTDTGEVTTEAGRRLVPFSNRTDCRRFVRLCFGGKRRGVAVARLVWMARTDQLIPEGWEVHHEDEDCGNDRWENLICLHPLDHRKKHGQAAPDDEVPF